MQQNNKKVTGIDFDDPINKKVFRVCLFIFALSMTIFSLVQFFLLP
jgi:hypothetical protein